MATCEKGEERKMESEGDGRREEKCEDEEDGSSYGDLAMLLLLR